MVWGLICHPRICLIAPASNSIQIYHGIFRYIQISVLSLLLPCLVHMSSSSPEELFAQMNEPVLEEISAMEGTIFSFSHYLPRQDRLRTVIPLLCGSSHLVSRFFHSRYKWINPTYPTYNWGYNVLTK